MPSTVAGVYGSGQVPPARSVDPAVRAPARPGPASWPRVTRAASDGSGPCDRDPWWSPSHWTSTPPRATRWSTWRLLAPRAGISATTWGARALTEEAHLLQLVEEYVRPQCGVGAGGSRAKETGKGLGGAARTRTRSGAAQVALEFLKRTQFPLDWRRSRAEGLERAAGRAASARPGRAGDPARRAGPVPRGQGSQGPEHRTRRSCSTSRS